MEAHACHQPQRHERSVNQEGVGAMQALKPLLMGAPDQDADEDAEDAGAASDEGSDAEGALHAAETPSPAPQAVAPAAQARLDAKVPHAACGFVRVSQVSCTAHCKGHTMPGELHNLHQGGA